MENQVELRNLVAIMDNSTDCVAMADLEGNTLYNNATMFDILGYQDYPQRFLTIDEVHVPEDIELIRNVAIPAAIKNGFWRGESRLRHLHGHTVSVEQSVFPVRNNKGKIFAVGTIMRDITDRKNMELILIRRKNQLDSIIKAAPIGIGVVVNRVIQEVNDTVCKMTGYTAEELINQNSKILYPRDEDYLYVGKEKYAQIQYHHVGTVETRWKKKDGGLIDILLSSSPINPSDLTEGVTFTALDITEKKLSDQALRVSEEKYRLIAENTADTIAVLDMNLNKVYVSPSVINLRGYTVDEAMSHSLPDMFTPESMQLIYRLFEEEMALEARGDADPMRSQLLEQEVYHKDGKTIWVETKYSFIRDTTLKPIGILIVTRDISKRKQAQEEIFKQKAQFEALFTNTNDAMVFFDNEERITDINSQFTKLFGYETEEVIGKNVNSIIDPFQKISVYGSTKTLKGDTIEFEAIRYTKTGREIPVDLKGGPVYINGVITGAYAVYTDITERKRYEEDLKYLSLHDKLTGLYNRALFEEEIKRYSVSRAYPITIISIDVDGLKLINDTMGHDSGDELLKACAHVIKRSLRSSDILARIGGDEFAIILPNTDEQNGEILTRRIKLSVEAYNLGNAFHPLSVSIGMATGASPEHPLEETFKKADDAMYRNKLHKAASTKSKIIDTLMKALGERDYITEGHGKRLTEICIRIGEAQGLSSSQLDNIALLAQVHDLGKVGIPDKILFKKGPLTDGEWEIMRQHPEKGYRIAIASPDLLGVADLILRHHERWDGKGYPLGLKGEEIPVECRILSIVDAYDAMTNDRPYSKAKTLEEAVFELKRCSGTQFDPELIEIFISIVNRFSSKGA